MLLASTHIVSGLSQSDGINFRLTSRHLLDRFYLVVTRGHSTSTYALKGERVPRKA